MSTFLSSQRAEYLDLHRHLSATSSGRRGRALTNADRDRLEAEVNRAVMDINATIDQLKESIRDPPPEEEEEEEEAEPEDEQERAARAARALERQQNNADVRAHQHTVIILLFDALRQLAASMASLKTARTAQLKADLEERHPGALAAAKKQDAEREERRMRGAAAEGDNSAAATSTSAAAAAAASSAVDLLPSALGKAVSSSLGKLQRIGGLDAGGGQNDTAAPVIDGQCHAYCSCSCGRDVGVAFRVLPILIVSARALCISLCVPDGPSAAPSLVFSAQERLLLQEENHHLLDSLEDNLDAMRRAESQLAAIASLMTLFSTKVLEQEEQIGTIYDQAIKSQHEDNWLHGAAAMDCDTQRTHAGRASQRSHPSPRTLWLSLFLLPLSSPLQALCTCTAASRS